MTSIQGCLLLFASCVLPVAFAPPNDPAAKTHPQAVYVSRLLNPALEILDEPEYKQKFEEEELQWKKEAEERKKKQAAEFEDFLKALPHVIACFTSMNGPCIANDDARKLIVEQKCDNKKLKKTERPDYDRFNGKCATPGMLATQRLFFSSEAFHGQDTLLKMSATFLCDPEFGLKQQPNPSDKIDQGLCDRIKSALASPAESANSKPQGVASAFPIMEAKQKYIRKCAEKTKTNKNDPCAP